MGKNLTSASIVRQEMKALCPRIKVRFKAKINKHCQTCSCKARTQCTAVVPASDYRAKGRCLNFSVVGDRCKKHPL